MRKLFLALFALLLAAGVANAFSTVTVTVSFAYGATDGTHGAATGAAVQSRSDGGAYSTYCSVTSPTASCTGAALPIGHTYDFKVIASNSFGNAPDSSVVTLAAFTPNGASNVTFTYSVQ